MNRSVHKDTCRIWDRGVCNCGPINAAPESRDAGGAAPSVDSDGGATHRQLIEAVAKAIYRQWVAAPGFVPWVEGGNAENQDDARRIARKAIEEAHITEQGEAVAPEARADVLKQLRTAMDVVSALCDGSMRWTMSVPARPDSDPDLVISGALHAAEKLIAAAPPAPPAPLPDHAQIVTRILQAVRTAESDAALRIVIERELAALSAQAAPEYRTGFDEAPSTFTQEDAAPADYPPPDILFDSYAVYQALSDKAKARTSAENVADVLDAIVRAQRSGVSADPLPDKKLWLWKNFVDGRPEYWAFDNPYPCRMDCWDPQTLGEPCGYALLKPSREGRTDWTEEKVLHAIKNARPAKE